MLREKIMGCWLGKAVGGTLGMPFEGCPHTLNLNFYDPVPSEMVANDDLDLQVVWACVLDEMETPAVNKRILGEAWLKHVEFPWDEYGVAIRNMRNNIFPPASGWYDNWFTNGLGAAIRSEIWACLAPGDPDLAARYAYEDACVDHAGEGIHAEVFLAALESVAFVESDMNIILDRASIHLPVESLVRRCVTDVRLWHSENVDWREIREKIIEKYGCENFTDVVMNLGFVTLGLLAGGGDFSKSICVAVNCGMDTDCTGASVGAIMGILNPGGIDEKWLAPIGDELVLSKEIKGITPPADLGGFTDLVLRLKDMLNGAPPMAQEISELSDGNRCVNVEMGWVDKHISCDPDLIPRELFKPTKLDGTFVRLPVSESEKMLLGLKYKIKIEKRRECVVFFNTPENCRIFVDGEFVFGRESGRMAPSAHRIPFNQSAIMTLSPGTHELMAYVVKPHDKQHMEWVVGVADANSQQWLPDVFI